MEILRIKKNYWVFAIYHVGKRSVMNCARGIQSLRGSQSYTYAPVLLRTSFYSHAGVSRQLKDIHYKAHISKHYEETSRIGQKCFASRSIFFVFQGQFLSLVGVNRIGSLY